MKNLETLHLDDASGKKNKFARPRTHLTTMEIGEIMPLMHEELIPGDTVNVSEGIFSRLAPLAVPTYGSFSFRTATMFVDYYQLFKGAESWFSGKTVSRGSSVVLPHFTKGDLVNFFASVQLSSSVSSPSDTAKYDFCYTVSGNSVKYFKFTRFGKWCYKVFRSLGYQIPSLVSTTANLSDATGYSKKLNALPFLAFCKAYNDYMFQSQRYDTGMITSRLETIRLGNDYTNWYTASSGRINYLGLPEIMLAVKLQYENDYFTSCWQSPNNPINTNSGDVTSINYYYSDSTGYKPVNSTVNNITTSTISSTINQRSLDFLRSFDNWVRRNNYSGSKDVEKIYSRFGIKPEFYKANYCHLVNTSRTNVQVGDVTSLSDTKTPTESIGEYNGTVLGEYAGKGIVNGDTGYKYRADDFGMLITLGWITVKPIYSNGYDRAVLRTDALDFYNPEFDGLGGNPVSLGEVFVDRKNHGSFTTYTDETIFGFNERYDEYKSGNLDQITGDFTVYEDMSTWHFDRTDLKGLFTSGSLVAQNSTFNSLWSNSTTPFYNRIFNAEADMKSLADHFYVSAQFDLVKYSNMKSLNEVPNLGEGSTVVPRNGNTLN